MSNAGVIDQNIQACSLDLVKHRQHVSFAANICLNRLCVPAEPR